MAHRRIVGGWFMAEGGCDITKKSIVHRIGFSYFARVVCVFV